MPNEPVYIYYCMYEDLDDLIMFADRVMRSSLKQRKLDVDVDNLIRRIEPADDPVFAKNTYRIVWYRE